MRLSVLELLFIVECLLLLSAAICYLAGKYASRRNRNDWLYRTATVFWREFRHQPLFGGRMPEPIVESGPVSAEPVEGGDWEGMLSDDDEPSSRPAMRPARASGRPRPPDSARAEQKPEDGVEMATISVKVIPHSSRNGFAGRVGDALKIQVTAAAEQGKANKAMTDVLAEALGIKAYQIQLIRGHYQPQKLVRITGLNQREVDERLDGLMD